MSNTDGVQSTCRKGQRFCAAALMLAATALAANGQDVASADRLIREVFSARDTSRYEAAAEAYLDLLARAGEQPSDDEARELRLTHLAQAVQVMPPADRPAEVDSDLLASGPRIARWWRRQDPFPATRPNERLEEHLERFVEAAAKLSGKDGAIDDRGRIFVRFGPPSARRSVALPAPMRAFDLGAQTHASRLLENELWVYDHISDDAHFFFLRDEGTYRLATPSRLIPAQLRSGTSSRSVRGREKSETLLLVAEEIYGQLALAHPFYGTTFDDIAHYRGRPGSGRERPADVARSVLAAASVREVDAAARRSAELPASYSNTRGLTEDLRVAARRARFLEADRTTRTEIYWAIPAGELEPSERLVRALEEAGHRAADQYVLVVSGARLNPDYERRDVQRFFYHTRSPGPGMDTKVFTLHGDGALFHAALQWDLYWAVDDGESAHAYGPALKTGTVRFDSVAALDPDRFEMSDLRIERNGSPIADQRAAPTELYFELYHLLFGADDLTRYTVEYSIRRADGRADVLTRAATSQSGSERTTRERIALDLTAPPGTQRLQIEVRVIDEISGERRARTAVFEF